MGVYYILIRIIIAPNSLAPVTVALICIYNFVLSTDRGVDGVNYRLTE